MLSVSDRRSIHPWDLKPHIKRIKCFDRDPVIGLIMRQASIKCSEVIKLTQSMWCDNSLTTTMLHNELYANSVMHNVLGCMEGNACRKLSFACKWMFLQEPHRPSVMPFLCAIKTHLLQYMKWYNS